MRPSVLCAVAALAAGTVAPPCSGQRAPTQDEYVERIVGAAATSDGAYGFLRRLTDSIGARVSGSAESRRTAELLVRTLQEAGFSDAHLEPYSLQRGWQRGGAAARVVQPVNRGLVLGSYGWVPGTDGEVVVPVVDLGAPTARVLPLPAGGLLGAAVIVEPAALEGAPAQVVRAEWARALAEAGASAMLIPSDKPNRLLYTSAFGFYPRAPLPVLSLAMEDALFLRRLLVSGPVVLALDVANTFGEGPVDENNVVAEIAGNTRGESVLVGAHFDSWDWGQGAQDDGTGVAAVLEAARILRRLGVRPRRTIRFVFFSGEEQGLLGSRAYVEAHDAELDGLRAALMDDGAQLPRGLKLHGRADVAADVRELLAPLSALGASGVSLDADSSEDHAPFLAAGVPAFTLWVEDGDYEVHHHAASDTFDKVDRRALSLDTAVLAAAAFLMAEVPQPPGHRLSAREAARLLDDLGLTPLQRVLYEAGSDR